MKTLDRSDNPNYQHETEASFTGLQRREIHDMVANAQAEFTQEVFAELARIFEHGRFSETGVEYIPTDIAHTGGR